ncbi:MAG TPA: hypothetical protein VJ901_11190 [Thermoanaerobaculia bacterium]|nr:hypothetical protein [Thermoanaerobaculia bacterium]
MAIPGEDFVHRLRELQPTLLFAKVLDVMLTSARFSVVLVSWGYGTPGNVDRAGFSVLRFDALGNLVWQTSKELSYPDGSERGKWIVERATMVEAEHHNLTGCAVHVMTGELMMFGAGFDNPATAGDPPVLVWSKHYYSDFVTAPNARITSMARMARGGDSVFSATRLGFSYLVEIDDIGNVQKAWELASVWIERLRSTPDPRFFAIGTYAFAPGSPEGALRMEFDAGSLKFLDGAMYTDGSPVFPLRWTDLALGDKAWCFVGHKFDAAGNEVSPMIGFTNQFGFMEWASEPVYGNDPVSVRRVTNHRDVIVTAGPFPTTSTYAVCGEAGRQPWLMVINEDRSIQWQKNLRTPSGATGRFDAVAWPSYDQVLAGGHYDIAAVPRGVLDASRTVIGRGSKACGVEANVSFPAMNLKTFHQSTTILEKNFLDQSSPLFDGPLLEIAPGCLDMQGDPAPV